MPRVDLDKCWLWARGLSSHGYAKISIGGVKYYVHRLMWEYANNEQIPESLVIDHLCMIKRCINPAHLEVVTNRENILRAPDSMAKINALKTHCKQGHVFDKENTYQTVIQRHCKKCWQVQARRRYQRKKLAQMLPVTKE